MDRRLDTAEATIAPGTQPPEATEPQAPAPQPDPAEAALAALAEAGARSPSWFGAPPAAAPQSAGPGDLPVELPHRRALWRDRGAALRREWEARHRPRSWRGALRLAAVGGTAGAGGIGVHRLARGSSPRGRDLAIGWVCSAALSLVLRAVAPKLLERRLDHVPPEILAELEARAAADRDWADWRLHYAAFAEGVTGRRAGQQRTLRLPGGVHMQF